MAIKTSYEYMDMTYPEAYLMIKKITTGTSDQEYFEIDSNGFDTLKFEKIHESNAYVFIYGDQHARQNGCQPIHAFGVEFEYNPINGGNIYEAAYEALKKTETVSTRVWENV